MHAGIERVMAVRDTRRVGSILRDNFEALRKVDPQLQYRLCLPADDSHLQFKDPYTVLYKIHRSWYPLEPDIPNSLSMIKEDSRTRCLVFGIGLGKQLVALLTEHPTIEVIAWDRDPNMLRFLLQHYDLKEALYSKKLTLCLGPDLLDYQDKLKEMSIFEHPFLGPVYHREKRFFQTGPHRRVTLLCEGALFVEDMANAFEKAGFGVYPLDTRVNSEEEMRHIVRKTGATHLASINYQHMLAEFAHHEHLKLITWEIDPSLENPEPPLTPTSQTYIFSYRKENAKEFQEAGFQHAEYLPLAADLKRRYPSALTKEEQSSYGVNVSFVGASLVQDALLFSHQFIQHYVEWKGGGQATSDEAKSKLEIILNEQRSDFFTYRVGELLKREFGEFQADLKRSKPYLDLEMMIAQAAASEKRLNIVTSLAPFKIKVWGDHGWAKLEPYGVEYAKRYAQHDAELNKIYSASLINIDIGRIYQSDIVTMRVFDVIACGGFVIAEYSNDLEELFEIGKEIVAYRSIEELKQLVDYYLAHPLKARVIVNHGRQALIKRHNMALRFQHIFKSANILENTPGPTQRNEIPSMENKTDWQSEPIVVPEYFPAIL